LGIVGVPEYRLYCLGDDGRIAKSHEIHADDDSDALEKARAMNLDLGCELWNRNRLVGKLPPQK
jgi:hypothetical protein